MNRILQADVILTLTADQVSLLGNLLRLAVVVRDGKMVDRSRRALVDVICEQVERQGFKL